MSFPISIPDYLIYKTSRFTKIPILTSRDHRLYSLLNLDNLFPEPWAPDYPDYPDLWENVFIRFPAGLFFPVKLLALFNPLSTLLILPSIDIDPLEAVDYLTEHCPFTILPLAFPRVRAFWAK